MQSKKFLNGKKDFLVMLVRVAPYLAGGVLAVLLGRHLALLVPEAGRLYVKITFLGILISLVLLEAEPGWNQVLLVCFGLAAGMMMSWSDNVVPRISSRIIHFVLLIIALAGGYFFRGSLKRAAAGLFPCILLFTAGWIVIKFSSLPALAGNIWIMVGLFLYTLFLIVLIVQGKYRNDEESPIPLSIQLFVMIMNLYWLTSML